MRLYLSSYGLGNKPERLITLVGKEHPKVGVITNASDTHTDQELNERYEYEAVALQQIGFHTIWLDLRKYIGRSVQLHQVLSTLDMVWVKGGNTFLLRRAMIASGFDQAIMPLLETDAIVYAGYSAGSVVAAKDLHGIELVDDPLVTDQGYEPETPWQGLGLVDFIIAPHYRSGHPESEAIEATVKYFKHHQRAYEALRDGEVIVIDGQVQEKIS